MKLDYGDEDRYIFIKELPQEMEVGEKLKGKKIDEIIVGRDHPTELIKTLLKEGFTRKM